MHLQVRVVGIDLPKDGYIVVDERSKVMFSVRVIIGREGTVPAYLIQQLRQTVQRLHALGDDNTAPSE